MLDISKLTFLDSKAGLEYCCDDVGTYEDILLTYLMESRKEGLDEALENNDLKSYQVQVHALKSASKMIGAMALSELAAEQEDAAKHGDAESIGLHHSELIRRYSTLMEQLGEVLADCSTLDDIELWDGDDEEEPEEEDSRDGAVSAAAAPDGTGGASSQAAPAATAGSAGSQGAPGQDREETIDMKNAEVRDHMNAVDVSGSYILVVDDDDINIQIARSMLSSKYRVGAVNCGEDVMDSVRERTPDLILLDVHMKGMSGHDVIKQLKGSELYSEIPVIFLTADIDDDTEIQGFNEGAMDYIRKPFRREIAMQRIARILELSYLQKYLLSEVEKQTRKAEERRKKVERLSFAIIQALANTIDAKDKYTKGHSTRVSEYSCLIAEKMGFSPEEVQNMRYIALLHDLGKIGIPDAIINKPAKLTDEEYAVIKTHPVIGANILKDVTEMPNIEVGAKWHHEKYDGTGYPDGLVAENIPLVARIIGIADAYDAMTSKRSYRDVLPQATVRAEIERCLGTQFDPEIGRLMLEIIDQDTEYKLHE